MHGLSDGPEDAAWLQPYWINLRVRFRRTFYFSWDWSPAQRNIAVMFLRDVLAKTSLWFMRQLTPATGEGPRVAPSQARSEIAKVETPSGHRVHASVSAISESDKQGQDNLDMSLGTSCARQMRQQMVDKT